MCANNSSLFNKIFFNLYALAWRVVTPFLGRHKRLQDGFNQRFVPSGWASGYACGQLADRQKKDCRPEAAARALPGKDYSQNQSLKQDPVGNSDQGLSQKTGQNLTKSAIKTIWIQAASGGEAYLLLKLWQELKESYQGGCDLKILATTCTRQGMEVLCRARGDSAQWQNSVGHTFLGQTTHALHNPEGCSSSGGKIELCPQYFPFDAPDIIERAMREADPALLVLMETELWPALLQEAHRRNVPVVVLNGRLTPKAFKHYRLLPATFWRSLAPQHVLATSRADAERFAKLFSLPEVGLMSNLKFDLLSPSLKKGGVEAAPRFVQGPIVLFSSVRKEEADLLAESISLLKEMNSRCSVILVPRHLHHVPLWQQALERQNLQSRLCCSLDADHKPSVVQLLQRLGLLVSIVEKRNGLGAPAPASLSAQASATLAASGVAPVISGSDEVIIWNRFGDLKELYALADGVFVGGTLAPLGGQNFLEALAEGAQPCLGPHIDNFAWAKEAAFEFCTFVSTPQQLAQALNANLQGNNKPRAEVKAKFAEYVQKNSGGARQAVKLLQGLLTRV